MGHPGAAPVHLTVDPGMSPILGSRGTSRGQANGAGGWLLPYRAEFSDRLPPESCLSLLVPTSVWPALPWGQDKDLSLGYKYQVSPVHPGGPRESGKRQAGWGRGSPFSLVPPQAPPLHGPHALHPQPSSTFCKAAFFTPLRWVGGSHKPSPQPGGGPRGPSLCGQDELQLRGAPSCLGVTGPLHAPVPPSLTPPAWPLCSDVPRLQ